MRAAKLPLSLSIAILSGPVSWQKTLTFRPLHPLLDAWETAASIVGGYR